MASRKIIPAPQESDMPCSVSPAGERFTIPGPQDYAAEFERIQKLAERARAEGKEIVVVMGVGFVGAVMAAIVADTMDEEGPQQQIRHRLPEAEHAQLLENSPAQPGRVAGQSRGPGS